MIYDLILYNIILIASKIHLRLNLFEVCFDHQFNSYNFTILYYFSDIFNVLLISKVAKTKDGNYHDNIYLVVIMFVFNLIS